MEPRYQTFTQLILQISRGIQKIKNVEMAALGLKGKQVQCLFVLDQAPDGVSLTELCEITNEDKGAMSRTIKELTTQGLVYLEEKTAQKYRNPIKLTAAGQATAKIVTDKIAAILSIVSADIAPTERATMYRALGQIADNLTQICTNYGGKND